MKKTNKFSPEVRERAVRMVQEQAFIDPQRNAFGVEPLCKVLQVAPSAYWRHAALVREPKSAAPGSSATRC